MFDLKNIVRKNILALSPYSSARDEFKGSEGVFLDANENPFDTELNRYPDPHQTELKRRLMSLKKVKIENIFIGNGSDEVIDLAFRIFCNPGQDAALTFSPSYGMYDVSAAINDIQLIKEPLDSNFQIDLKNLEKHFENRHLKLLFICSPNNPTATILDIKSIEYILKKFNGIVLIDEAYIDFSPSESWVNFIEKYPNLIVSQTFSKAWGLAAARVGVAYASPLIISFFNKTKPPYNVSGLNQKAALNALKNFAKFEAQKTLILQERKKLIEVFERIKIIEKVYPSDSNFILIKVTDAKQIYQQLVSKNIVTRNRHKLIENCLRISVGTPEQNQLLIQELEGF